MRNIKQIPLLVILLIINLIVAAKTSRVALVIGNEEYQFEKLNYPVNNAQKISEKLIELGFKVFTYTNLDQNALKEAIDKFGSELDSSKTGLLYYSGIASQAKGENYMVPVDANPTTENDVEYSCVSIGRVLGKMEDAGTTNIIILDASNDNQFERTWNFNHGIRGRGLAFMDAPYGSLIAYSTSPGRVTHNKEDDLSTYTQVLLKFIDEANLSIEDMFKKIRVELKDKSKGEQIPWESTSLEGNFYFKIDENFNDLVVKGITIKREDKSESKREIRNTFTDERDKQVYEWVKIGSQVWMAENLNYKIDDYSWCYDNLQRNCDIYGRLYSYKGALESCPDGWHLPSDEEWKMLEIYAGMSRMDTDIRGVKRGTIQGGKLKMNSELWDNPNNGATNEFNFNIIPGGWRDENGVYGQMHKWAWFWTSSVQTEYCAWSRIFINDMTIIERYNILTPVGQSVRCVKD